MDIEIEELKRKMKKNKKYKVKKNQNKKIKKIYYSFVSRILITIIVTLLIFISIRSSKNFKEQFYKEVYEKNISFATINNWYQKKFGEPLPLFDKIHSKTEPVFSEKLNYQKKEEYKEGVKITVEENYLVPALESGMVVYVGEKEGYGNTVVIQQVNGIDVWYGNMKNISVKLYDYVEKGKLVGEVKDNFMYFVYKKDGKVLDYEKYLTN